MTETQSGVNATIRKEGLKNGVYLGLAVLALSIFSFYFTTTIVTAPMLIIGGSILFAYLLPFILAVFFAFMIRSRVPGVPSYRQFVTGIFIMLVTCYAILTVGQELVFAKLIEPDMAHKTEIAMEKSQRIVYKAGGLNQSEIDAKVTETQKTFRAQSQATVGNIIMHYAINVMLLFVLSLIIGLMVKGGIRT